MAHTAALQIVARGSGAAVVYTLADSELPDAIVELEEVASIPRLLPEPRK
jgi:hypothetical protein